MQNILMSIFRTLNQKLSLSETIHMSHSPKNFSFSIFCSNKHQEADFADFSPFLSEPHQSELLILLETSHHLVLGVAGSGISFPFFVGKR